MNAARDRIASEQRKVKTLLKNIKIDESALAKKEDQMNKVSSEEYWGKFSHR